MEHTGIAKPHRGYHGPRGTQRFFEGWYYRLSLPEQQISFATIYSIEDPYVVHPWRIPSPFQQGGVQVLGPEGLLVETFPDISHFWAKPDTLAFGQVKSQALPRRGMEPKAAFWEGMTTGYQADGKLNQGCIQTPSGATARWEYVITPVTGWGHDAATMGLLSYLPVYEVGWQICVAHGWATGFFEWQDQRYEFTQAPVYIEKNWGLGYPAVWFWLQCNSFTVSVGKSDPHLTLTAGGGLRKLLQWEDQAAMIGLHYRGRFFNFRPETGQVRWFTQVTDTACWRLWGGADGYEIEVDVTIPQEHLHSLLGPSTTATLHPISLHSLVAGGTVRLYRGRGGKRVLCLEAHSTLWAAEVGGDRWLGAWEGTCG